MSLQIHSLLSHYSNCIDLSSMLPSYLPLFHHSIDNLMYHPILLPHYMFMHPSHLSYYLLLLYLYVLVLLFHAPVNFHYTSLLMDYLVPLHLLYLLSMSLLLMLMYSYYTFTVLHLHLNNLPLLLSFMHLLLNYHLMINSSSLLLLMSLLSLLLNVHFHHMSMSMFTMLLLSISSLYYNQMLLPM